MKKTVIRMTSAITLFVLISQSLMAQQDSKAPTLNAIQPVSRFGVCTHMRRRDHGWQVENLIPITKQMGVSIIRDGLSWGRTEKVKGQYALDPEDAAWINAALDGDVKIILMLGYGNAKYDNPLDPQGYARFCAWVAEHFKGNDNIHALELWNEPSNFHVRKKYSGAWNAKGDSPWLEKFAEMIELAAAAVKAADSSRTVITGGGNPPASMHMIEQFPEAFVNVDGLTLHPYSYRLPPEVVPYGGKGIAKRDGVSSADDDHSMVSLWQTLEAQMQKQLGRKLGIWVTEVGYTTFNHTLNAGLFAGYTQTTQAAYLTRSVIAGLAWPNIKTWCLYDLMDDGTNPKINEDNFGIVRHSRQGLAPKQSFFALRRMSELLGSEYEILASPPVQLVSKALELDQNDVWKKKPVDSYITDTSAKVHWFKTDKGYVTFIWRAGRINGEHNPPLGKLPTVVVPDETAIHITDLISGQSLDHLVHRVGNDVTINNLPVQGHPLAIAWNTVGQLQPLTPPQAGGTIDLPLTHARGKWKFTNGPEFKGAAGSIDVPQQDKQPLVLNYDFTGGGNYVAAIKYLNPRLNIQKLRLGIDTTKTSCSIRVIDRSGQTFQYRLGSPEADKPVTLDLSKAKPQSSWGGAKDRKIHYPLSSIWIMVDRKSQPLAGKVSIETLSVTLVDESIE